MHALTIVVLPPAYRGDIEDGVGIALAPFDENREVEQVTEDGETYWRNPHAIWDWWQIGGRYTGHLDNTYEPARDSRNWEPCIHCGGSGVRAASGLRDGKPWCNGCTHDLEDTGTPGVAVKWPSQWVDCPRDVARLGDVREILERPEWPGRPFHLVHEGVTSAERYNPAGNGYARDGATDPIFVDTSQDVIDAIRKLSDDCTVVVVDVHI